MIICVMKKVCIARRSDRAVKAGSDAGDRITAYARVGGKESAATGFRTIDETLCLLDKKIPSWKRSAAKSNASG